MGKEWFVSLLVALCAKHAGKHSSETSDQPNTPLKSPLPWRHKAMKLGLECNYYKIFGNNKKNKKLLGQEADQSGLWQKAIMMGEKCEPPEFSGVIYYDCAGNRIPVMPKSPRAGNTSLFGDFAFTMEKMDNSKC